ncbi:MAG TPA: VWA domain-containing protein, partial [Gemmataceae bacterium]|nr:VWA domain-containing protein [Gemmataceae bacterium]
RLQHPAAVDDVNNLASVTWEHAKANSTNIIYAVRSMVDGLGKMPGPRMLLLASSGFLSGDLEYLQDELITRALHAEVVINALDAKGLYTYPAGGRPIDAPAPRGRSVRTEIAEAAIAGRQEQAKDDGMAVLALGTGGSFYHNSNDLNRGFQELGVLPEVVYVLGFSPSDAAADGRYHGLKVKLAAGNHYSVQSRLGYTAATRSAPVEQKPASKLDLAVMASDTPADVPAGMTVQEVNPSGGAPTLNLVVHVDVGKLKFETQWGRRSVKLTFVLALLDAGGSFLSGTRSEMELSLKQDTFDRLAGPGFNVNLPVRAPAGKYTLRGVVQEGIEGKMTALSQVVEIR